MLKTSLITLVSCLCSLCMLAQEPTAFERMLSARGVDVGNVADYSRDSIISMPEPRLAYVNLTGFNTMPAARVARKMGWMEVYDGDGRHFKLPVTLSAQGNYSLRYPKKNFVCRFCDEDWDEENGASLRIGDWVEQDAFHFKAFYTDFLRGIGEVGYKVFSRIVADRAPYWERGGYHKESLALCYPDGFPCVVYLNGEFYGIYAWQLKKSRKNMNQKKTRAEHVHLDGSLQNDFIFRGNVAWRQFEVRNPKGLYDRDGNPYKGDSPKELIDEKCAAFNDEADTEEVKLAKRRTAQVKQYILRMSRYWDELNTLEKEGATPQEMREEIEKRYDIGSLVDYHVFFYLSANGDGTLKNWQWFTYDGQKWMVTPYDLDQIFGINLYGVVRPAAFPMSELVSGPFYWLNRYYQKDIRERYIQLREEGVIAAQPLISIANDWHERVGEDFYAQEKSLWSNSPCYQEAVCSAGWEVSDDWEQYDNAPNYNAAYLYQAGDLCKLEGRLWRATQMITGVRPYITNANLDTIDRLRGWMADRIDYLDAYFVYEPSVPDGIADPAMPAPSRKLQGIYTPAGMRVDAPVKGVNIYLYSDGTSRKVLVP